MRSAVVLLTLLLSPAWAEGEPLRPVPVPVAERDALFEWYDGLELPSVDGLACVEITEQERSFIGFVEHEDDDGFVLLTAALSYRRGSVEGPNHGHYGWLTYEPVQLADVAREYAERVRGEQAQDDWLPSLFDELPERAQLVVMARALARRGDLTSSDALLGVANVLRGRMDWHDVDTSKSLRVRVEEDLEGALRSRVWRGGGTEAQWRDDMAEHARRFPDAMAAEDTRELARILGRMAVEAPFIPEEGDLAELAGEELTQALILQLRYLGGHGVSMMGGPAGTFAEPWGQPPNAADRLRAIGAPAIPLLVEAVDDDTLTRISFTGRGGWSPGVVTVGQVAMEILGAIVPDEISAHGAAAWESWWLARTRVGEQADLVRRAAAGGDDGLAAARALVARYPADAVWPVEAGWDATPSWVDDIHALDPWIDLYATIDHPRVAAHLERKSRYGYRLVHRVAAVLALHRVDSERALRAARRAARFLPEESHVNPSERAPSRRDLHVLGNAEYDAALRLITFLAERGEARVFLDRWRDLRPPLRLAIARETALRAAARPESVGAEARMLLVAALRDDAVVRQISDVGRGEPRVLARVRDGAAFALGARWGRPLEPSAPPPIAGDLAAWCRVRLGDAESTAARDRREVPPSLTVTTNDGAPARLSGWSGELSADALMQAALRRLDESEADAGVEIRIHRWGEDAHVWVTVGPAGPRRSRAIKRDLIGLPGRVVHEGYKNLPAWWESARTELDALLAADGGAPFQISLRVWR